jgi:ubiquinone/menaquinone biosynthesis C-methylase UbiE
MELETAIRLIKKAISALDSPQRWADLGAGTGLFTQALATQLPPKSSILAVDKNGVALQSIILKNANVSLQLQSGDFTTVNLANGYDGFLLANALHYVQNATAFLIKLKSVMSSSGRLVIVEYDRSEPNPWVPYPLPLEKLKQVGQAAGFTCLSKLEEVPSIYESVSIYSAVLTVD